MSQAYRTALAALRRAHDALRDSSGLTVEQREELLHVADDALQLLEASAPSRRAKAKAIAARVAVLRRELRDRTPGERKDIICQRLGISRSDYYRAMKESH